MDKYIGRLLDNRYEILEVIGTGGMAVVYKARCHRLNRLVAIKILKSDYLEDEDFRRRFHTESQAVAMLSHPNIVSVYDVSTSVSLEADYIVMELIEGITLKQYMEKKGFLNWKETLHFAIQIAKALEHAHSRGIVHRDIKPHNVMVLKNGSVKVMDFGIARMMSKGNTLTKEALGSVHYISPEQAKGGRIDSRSDIYSLGVVMYEMMCGRPPYDGDSPVAVAIQHINGGAPMPSTINPNIPGGLEQIIMRAMAQDITQRYASAAQMLVDMDDFRKDPTILFDYNTPPTDAVIGMQKKPAQEPVVAPVLPRTTAERVAGRTDPAKRTASRPKPVPTPKPEAKAASPQEAKRRRAEEQARNRVALIAIIICAAVAILSIGIVLLLALGGGNSNNQLVEVPGMIGYDYQNFENYPGITLKVQDWQYDAEKPANTVLDQEPKAGEKIKSGEMVFVIVSKGAEPKEGTMSDLTNYTRESAQSYLNGLDMKIQVLFQEEFSDDIQEGKVIRTEPTLGSPLVEGQTVTLYISLGQEIKEGLMPNILDIPVDLAIRTLNNQNLDLDIRTEEIFDTEVVEGNVISSDPEKGSPLKTGQKVTLYVSKGAEKVNMPDLVGKDLEVARSLLEYAGFPEPEIKYEFSDKKENQVINQSEKKNSEVAITTKITLTVSKGPEPTEPPEVTMRVTIDLQGYADEAACQVVIYAETTQVYNGTVEAGTASVILENQKGVGTLCYTVIINGGTESGGAELEQWVEFKA